MKEKDNLFELKQYFKQLLKYNYYTRSQPSLKKDLVHPKIRIFLLRNTLINFIIF